MAGDLPERRADFLFETSMIVLILTTNLSKLQWYQIIDITYESQTHNLGMNVLTSI